MELILIFTGAFIVALSGALVPGPLLTITVAQSLKRGFKAGPLIIAGHAILELALITAILLGFKNFLGREAVIITVYFAGGIMLIYMGTKLFSANKIPSPEESDTPDKDYETHPVISGILVSLSNPYWLIWWITIGLGYIIKALKYKYMGLAFFFGGHITADLAWYSIVSFTISRGKTKITGTALYKNLITACGVFLILFGLWFIGSGLYKIL
ncbi:MAG: LysE family transporter [Elusimicrobiota bacterium]|nr:LysE family transporter [Elusimicrobiota bacterium]